MFFVFSVFFLSWPITPDCSSWIEYPSVVTFGSLFLPRRVCTYITYLCHIFTHRAFHGGWFPLGKSLTFTMGVCAEIARWKFPMIPSFNTGSHLQPNIFCIFCTERGFERLSWRTAAGVNTCVIRHSQLSACSLPFAPSQIANHKKVQFGYLNVDWLTHLFQISCGYQLMFALLRFVIFAKAYAKFVWLKSLLTTWYKLEYRVRDKNVSHLWI